MSVDIFGAIQQLSTLGGQAATGLGGLASGAADLLSEVPLLEGADIWVIPSPDVPVPFPVPIPCQFNPEQLEFEKRARWRTRHTTHRNTASATYSGGTPQNFSLELFFDTTDSGADVRVFTTPLMMLTERMPLINQPPLCMFQWGLVMSPISYVERVRVKYVFFSPSGTPLRAEVNISMREYDLGFLSKLPLNPTSRSEARKTWVVLPGQTIDWIAYKEYGDPAQWRHIARTNNIANPMELTPGMILKLTPIP